MMNNNVIEIPTMETTGLVRAGTSEISPSALVSFQEGLDLMESGQAKLAVSAFSRCLEEAPTFAAGHMYLGTAHAVGCEVYPAIDHLEKAAELDPESFAAHYMLSKFYFTLRIPQKGYAEATLALRCATDRQQRQALSQLLHGEREREKHGMARPWFNRKFGIGTAMATGCALATLLIAIFIHWR